MLLHKSILAASLLALMTASGTAAAAHPGLDQFVQRHAAETGFAAEELRAVLERAEFQQAIIDSITRPAEAKPWHEYRQIFLRDPRIDGGAEFWRENQELFDRIGTQFGVSPEFVLAIVGVETNYGRITGSYRVLDALVTLGFYYPRRGEFFSRELAQFFSLSREENLPLEDVLGSYAGAMGIGQFIPSSYRAYAVDFDDSGSRDLWRSLPDALGSVANYLKVHGWEAGRAPALPVTAAPARIEQDFPVKPAHTLAALAELGFEFDAGELPPETPATVIELEGVEGPEYWIGLNNFYVITRYNRSPLYAMAVTQLAEAIRERAATAGTAAP
jgi:membrane-bound lytic murein transglycosylase B